MRTFLYIGLTLAIGAAGTLLLARHFANSLGSGWWEMLALDAGGEPTWRAADGTTWPLHVHGTVEDVAWLADGSAIGQGVTWGPELALARRFLRELLVDSERPFHLARDHQCLGQSALHP